MMKSMTVVAASLLALALAGTSAAAQKAEDAVGTWLHPDNGSNVEFYKCGEGVCGKIVKVTDGQQTDDKNPKPANRNRPIVGLVIMQGAKKTGDNKWSGNLYNRENGSTYSGTVTVKSKNELDLSGCVAMVLCKTLTWTRVK